MQSNQKINRQNIVHKYFENPNRSASSIAKELKLSKRTCQNVIKKFKESLSVTRKPESGKKPGSGNKMLAKKIVRSFKNSPGLSIRDRAIRYKTSVFCTQTDEELWLQVLQSYQTSKSQLFAELEG
jgi:transposase